MLNILLSAGRVIEGGHVCGACSVLSFDDAALYDRKHVTLMTPIGTSCRKARQGARPRAMQGEPNRGAMRGEASTLDKPRMP